MSAFALDEFNIDFNQTNAIGMLAKSKKWRDAAKALLKSSQDKLCPGLDFSPPIYFLALQSLEITLKSFLHARGIDEKTLKKDFGHDLIKLMQKARELDLDQLTPITPELEARLSLMATDYRDKDLQYFMGTTSHDWALPAEIIDDVGVIYDALSDEYRSHSRLAKAKG